MFKENYNSQTAINQLSQHWLWYLVLGAGLTVLGLWAIFYAYAATMFSVVYFGIFSVVVGGFEVVSAFKSKAWGSFFMHAVLAFIYIVGGAYLYMHPMTSALALTPVFALFLAAIGLLKISFAIFKDVPHRFLVLFNGVVSLFLGFLLWKDWPISGLWAIGEFVGVEVFLTGISWVALALWVRMRSSK